MGDTEVKAEELQGGWARTAKDLTSGAAGGVAQVLIGKLICYFSVYHHIHPNSRYCY
jgi:hypothetical protein